MKFLLPYTAQNVLPYTEKNTVVSKKHILSKQMYRSFFSVVMILLFVFPNKAKAWGPKGHTIVVQIAMQLLKPGVKENVLAVLNGMSIDTAANWMDIQRSNPEYDFMKPWHYIDFPKEESYMPSTDENSVNKIIQAFNELRHKNVLCSDQVKLDLLFLMHLMGDLSQPLHNGYEYDLGGNKRPVQLDTLKTNLHHFWDENIIDLKNITLEDCLNLYKSLPQDKVDTIEGIHPALWMKESRTLLDKVYDFKDYTITQGYVDRSAEIVKRQLLIAGIRLANMLNKLFAEEAPVVDIKALAAKYKNGIDAKDAAQYVGKKVTACSHVYGIKSLDNVTFITLGGKFPNSTMTVVIFAKDRNNFKPSIEELYDNKNICVKGTIVVYKDKTEVIVSSPDDIIVY